MRSPAFVGALYGMSAAISERSSPVELYAIADPAGACLDRAIRELGRATLDSNIEPLNRLLTAARRLRWRIAVEPFASQYFPGRSDLLAGLLVLGEQSSLLVGSETRWMVDELVKRAEAVNSDQVSPHGAFLLEWLGQRSPAGCVVVFSGPKATSGGQAAFLDAGQPAAVVNDRERPIRAIYEQAIFVGPPAVFGSSPPLAPRAGKLAYLFPSWITDRSLPVSDFSAFAEGGIKPRVQLHRVGEEPILPARLQDAEEALVPVPQWQWTGRRVQAGEDEIPARQVLLCGGLSIMVDPGGDWIRTLDPEEPAGYRVAMRDVASVAPGTYLVLREGQTESGPLYNRAIALLGREASGVSESQRRWKEALARRLQIYGPAAVVRRLHAAGITAAAQAPSWTSPTLARPRRDDDFTGLLGWLDLPASPYVANANLLRRARSQAMADVREALEAALAEADVAALKESGFIRLDLELEGFAGIIATRVLALSPHLNSVPKSELRIPREDPSARWLE